MLKTECFWKKAIFPVNKRFWPNFFSQYRVWKFSRDSFQGSKRSSDNYCGNNKIISLGPKWLLKTKIFLKKKQPFQWKKDFGQFFSEYRLWKTSGNDLWGSNCILAKTVEVIRPFLWDLTGLLKTQSSEEKKANFPLKKNILAYIFLQYRVWKTWGNNF